MRPKTEMFTLCENCGDKIFRSASSAKQRKTQFCSKQCQLEIHAKKIVNYDFFAVIDNEEKAYWLGFIMADGYMCERDKAIGITISNKDKYHLQKFANIFKVDVKFYSSRQNARCMLHNILLYQALLNKGIYPRKSLLDSVEVFNHVSVKLLHHFIRGVFDGNGSICYGIRHGHIEGLFGITGTYKILEKMQSIIIGSTGVGQTKIYKDHSVFAIRWGGADQLCAIRDWLYHDASIFLERKHDIFLSINSPRIRKGTSKYRGVFWDKKAMKWRASIVVHCIRYDMGCFLEEDDAADACNKKLTELGVPSYKRNDIQCIKI